MTKKGRCLCGNIRIRISAGFQLTEFCHCQTCRRATGAPVMAWAAVPRNGIEIDGDSLSRFESSPGVERAFCGRCGTSLTLSEGAFPESVYVSIAALDDAASIAPEIQIWSSERLPWFDTADGLPRYLQFKRDGLQE